MGALDLVSHPVPTIHGVCSIPGDKSISHRAILLGAIAQGTTRIHGLLEAEDCRATLNAVRAMGVQALEPNHQELVIHGVGKEGLKKPKHLLDCGNSGTSMRLLAGLLAAQPFDSQLSGDESLLKRPMSRISEPLSQMGAQLSTVAGKAPISIKGVKQLQGIQYLMKEPSAQVKSCILLAGLYAQGKTTLIETQRSRDHTERLLKTFSYPVHYGQNEITIDAQSQCLGTDVQVPGDLSSAAFFMVAATLLPKASIWMRNVGVNPTRTGILDVLQSMGADITVSNKRYQGEEAVADLQIQHAPLRGITVAKELVPLAIDEFPILFIAAAMARGETVFTGLQELRLKESDRLSVMVQGLKQLGIEAHCFEEGAVVKGGSIQGGVVNSFGDHRVAMAFLIAGAVALAPVFVRNCAAIATSFPGFVTLANQLRLNIKKVTA